MTTSFDVPESLKVLIIDTTANTLEFEHSVSQHIHCALNNAGIPIVQDKWFDTNTSHDLMELLQTTVFNCLLLIAHGSDDHNDGHSQVACVGHDQQTPYHIPLWAGHSLSDKLVVLCVCHGGRFDWKTALVEQAGVAVLIGSDHKVSAERAKTFFPAFFQELWNSVRNCNQIPYDDIKAAFDATPNEGFLIYPEN